MASISIPYGRGTQTLHVDDARLQAVLTPNHAELSGAAQEEIVRQALEKPIGSVPGSTTSGIWSRCLSHPVCIPWISKVDGPPGLPWDLMRRGIP